MARADRRYFALSAQQVDPLSWFTGPLVPLAVTGIMLIAATPAIALTWGLTRMPVLQLVALVACVASPLIVHLSTRPLRRPIGWVTASVALALSAAGVIISAVGFAGSAFTLELWWAPVSFSLVIVSLGPYLPGRTLIAVGGTATIAMTTIALLIVYPTSGQWGPVGSAAIVSAAAVLSLVSMVAFSYGVVSTMVPLLESPSRLMVAGREVRDEAAEHIERVTLAQLTARAVPFIEGLATTGRVTPESRALAGQIARRLRDDLITQGSVTWLDSIAQESRLVVVDPDRLARRMNNPQRTALRGLLEAVLATPGTDSGSLMVELRKAPDGATAVAVSLDMALPEGRRIMHLAPYYLTLKTAVDDLEVGRHAISFRIAPRDTP